MNLNNVSILNLMPPNIAADQKVQMAAEAFDEVLRDIIKKIPNISVIPNMVLNKTVDEVLIDLLAWQFHVDFYDPKMSVKIKRDLVMKSLDWHFCKGTPSVVEEIVSTVFSRAEILEWFEYGGLPYRFRIGTEEEMPDAETRANLIRAINSVKNTRSYLDKIISVVYLEDEVDISDFLTMIVRMVPQEDQFGHRFQFNGAGKFDGHTQNEWIYVCGKFDGRNKFNGGLKFGGTRKFSGEHKFDGSISFGNAMAKKKNPYRLFPPFKFRSWIVDVLELSMPGMDFEDTQRAPFSFDGSIRFDGGSKYDGVSQYPINSPKAGRKNTKFNGETKFNGGYQYNGVFGNKIKTRLAPNAMSDKMASGDDMAISVFKHRHFNGSFRFNGAIKFDGVPSVKVG